MKKPPRRYNHLMRARSLCPPLLMLLLTACQPAAPASPPAAPAPPLTAPAPTIPPIPPVLARALAELSTTLALPPAGLELLGYQETIWQDACLDLPRAGEACIQALTPGYSASLVTAQGELLELRVDLTGRTARHVPGAALAARRELAQREAISEGSVRFFEIQPVDWADACLELPRTGEACAEVITPGYRVTLEANGRRVVYHTDRAGATIRSEAGSQSLLPDVLLTWRSVSQTECTQAAFGLSGVLFGACGGGASRSPYLSPVRLAELQEFTTAFAPFQALTPAGSVELAGAGNQVATPAQERMVAEWARLAAIEAQTGRTEQDWGLALRMDRSGGLPDFCDSVSVSVTGVVIITDCHSGYPLETNRYRLDPSALQTLYGWVDRLHPINQTLTGPPYTAALVVRLHLNAVGNDKLTPAEIQSLIDFSAALIDSPPPAE